MSARPAWTFEADLDALVQDAAPVWAALVGARILLTGGTGTIGRWLLESVHHANVRLGLGVEVLVLTRDPVRVRTVLPHLAGAPGITLIGGDVRDFTLGPGRLTHVIHGAAESSLALTLADPREMFSVIVDGTRHVLDLARERGARRVLCLSSGAVYGPQDPAVDRVSERAPTAPDPTDPGFVYGEAKRAAEMLGAIHDRHSDVPVAIGRIFSVLGPNLPLDAHFAAGNFIRDALAGRPVVVAGTGAPVRSYLYCADVAEWLWTILVRGDRGRAYNVGSEHTVTIRALAETVSRVVGDGRVTVENRGEAGPNPGRYVPSTHRARTELGLRERVSLEDAVDRTARWNRRKEPRHEAV